MPENIYKTKITACEFDEAPFEEGIATTTKIMKYTLANGTMEVDVIDYGATITAIRVPDSDGVISDVVLGFDSLNGYMAASNNPYFGATIGRVANRISNGKFTLNDVCYTLSTNDDENTIHGGIIGFNRKLWKSCVDEEGLVLRMTSPHLDQGFPGELSVEAKFILTKDNNLVIRYRAKPDRPTIVNLTNHMYFNLGGHDSGAERLYEHNLMINANYYTPNDDNNIPKGKVQDVIDTVLDFTNPKNVGEAIENTGDANGFDINFCVLGEPNEFRLVARLDHPCTGRRLIIHSNQPGVQLYTSNCLQVKDGQGKGGANYSKHDALCLETQNYPNAINVKYFPSCVFTPQNEYMHVVSYKFSVYEPEEERPAPPAVTSETVIEEKTDETEGAKSEEAASKSEPEEDLRPVKVCPNKIDGPKDPANCQVDLYPDFSLGYRIEFDDPLAGYEPVSSIFPDENLSKQKQDFDTVLMQCKDLAAAVSFKEISRCKYGHRIFNVITDTDLSPERRSLKATESQHSQLSQHSQNENPP